MARKTKEDSLRTRSSILDAAERVILERGISYATMADIADAAGVSRGAVYGHFENKIELAIAMCERAIALAVVPERDPAVPALEALYQEGMYFLKLCSEPGSVQRVLEILYVQCDSNEDNQPLLEIRDQWERQYSLGTEQLIREAIVTGDLPADIDIDLANLYLFSLFDGIYSTLFWTSRVKENKWEIAEALYRAGFSAFKNAPELREKAG
ncbi:TetR family transcriptional regulator [Methylobacillus arboreus]|uniref:TetR family transcriptional regulator n=1 Tax=Methylobacillus arboreus TaxID=755170 RepID=UPI001E3A4976|nr:TetR family transcriptional regulator [Methylobacillus arboreus]MCB5189780.1 TetR family transcriptional regulator [Methylobacillus arboreus]